MSSNRRFYENYHLRFTKTKPVKMLIKNNNFTYKNFFRYIFPYATNLKPYGKVLDVGCGAGTTALFLANFGYDVEGIDISPQAVKSAILSARFLGLSRNIKFKVVDLNVCKLSNKKYDIVICLEVLEHIQNDGRLLNSLCNAVKAGGLLILSVPLSTAPLMNFEVGKKFDKEVGHLRRYSEDEIISMLTERGMTVKKRQKTESIIRNALFVVPAFRRAIKIVRGSFSDFLTFLDDLAGNFFGYSDLIIISRK